MSASKWEPYPSYKCSETFAKKIPAHWKEFALKHVSSINDDTLPEDTAPMREMCYVDIGSVSYEEGIIECEKMVFEKSPSRARRLANDGDVIVSTVRTYLRAICKIENLSDEMVFSTGFAIVRPDNSWNKDSIGDFIVGDYFVENVVANSDGVSYPAINASDLACLKIIQPPKKEQALIKEFLEGKISKINSSISSLNTQITQLEEKRSALITQAVTKGPNSNVEMKETGIRFFPLIPIHWEIHCLKHIVDERRPITYGIVQCGPDLGDGVPYVRPVDMTDEGGVDMDNIQYTSVEIATPYARSTLKEGDLVVSIGPSYGKVMKIPSELEGANLTQGTARVAVDSKYHADYFFWAMRSSPMRQQWDSVAQGATFRALNLVPLWNSHVPTPSLEEQIEIARNLRVETSAIDQMIGSISAVITKLKEYRTALISAAVTGKIDLREWQGTGDDA